MFERDRRDIQRNSGRLGETGVKNQFNRASPHWRENENCRLHKRSNGIKSNMNKRSLTQKGIIRKERFMDGDSEREKFQPAVNALQGGSPLWGGKSQESDASSLRSSSKPYESLRKWGASLLRGGWERIHMWKSSQVPITFPSGDPQEKPWKEL